MKRITMRFWAFLLALLTLIPLAVACKGEESEKPEEPLTVVTGNTGAYTVVYDSQSAASRNAANGLVEALAELSGVTLAVCDDRTESSGPEIRVGRTKRGGELALQRTLRVDEWIIARDGEHLYILGDTDAVLRRACDYFLESVLTPDFRVTEKSGEIHRVSGRYGVESVTLNGRPITDYTVVAEGGDVDWGEILDWGDERLSAVSGYRFVRGVDADVQGPVILLKSDSTLQDAKHRMENEGDRITVTVGSEATALALLGGFLEKLPPDATGTVALTVAAGEKNVGDSAIVPLTAGSDIRVMTYNVLGHVKDAMVYVNGTVGAYLPDFLCTQEYYNEADKQVTAYLRDMGYGKICGTFTCASPTAVEKEDEQYTNVGKYCNTPIFYRTDRWELVESEAYLFYWQNRWPYTDTKSMAYGVFRSKENGQMVLVIGTHYALMGSGYTEYAEKGYTDQVQGVEWRYQNSVEILKAVDALRAKYPGILTVVGGDLNGKQSERGIELLENHAILSNSDNLAPAGNRSSGGSFHNTNGQAPGKSGAIDHIFVSEDVADVERHCILTDQYVLEGSDHCPVIADIVLK